MKHSPPTSHTPASMATFERKRTLSLVLVGALYGVPGEKLISSAYWGKC